MPAMVPDLPVRDGLHQPGCQQGHDMTMAEEPDVVLANAASGSERRQISMT
jgi:hypothetical protein